MLMVDAYNVLHVQGVLPAHLAGLEVDGLARLLGVSRYAQGRVVLVCDGAAPRTSIGGGRKVAGLAGRAHRPTSGGVEIVHAGGGHDADSYIEDFLERDSGSRRWTIVSSDRRIQRAAIAAGARVLESPVFLRQLVQDDARPAATPHPRQIHKIPLGSLDVSLWIKEFGIDPRAGDVDLSGVPDIVPPPRAAAHVDREIEQSGRTAGKRSKSRPDRAERRGFSGDAAGAPPSHRRPKDHASPPLPTAVEPSELDPLLHELLAGLEGGIRLEDLDMRRWLDEPEGG